mmetsp:Transcript_51806/g.112330  ORF Transcript_51806/g.112330 Transcript_51806/m.112330 type:complete len:149 (-) Transcript_51806:69-515(-)
MDGWWGSCRSEWMEALMDDGLLARLLVDDPNRARAWVKGWVDFHFVRGGKDNSAMRRSGLRTPVEVRQTELGVCLKFLPTGTREVGTDFDGLRQGGLEVIVDDARPGIPGRMRVRRCAYVFGEKPRESSERTILSRLKRDWETAQSFD